MCHWMCPVQCSNYCFTIAFVAFSKCVYKCSKCVVEPADSVIFQVCGPKQKDCTSRYGRENIQWFILTGFSSSQVRFLLDL